QPAATPRLIGRLLRETTSSCLDPHGQRVKVLRCAAPDAHSFALLTIATLGPVVLRQAQLAHACLERHASEHAAVGPSLARDEPKNLCVEAHATCEIIDGEAGFEGTQTQ